MFVVSGSSQVQNLEQTVRTLKMARNAMNFIQYEPTSYRKMNENLWQIDEIILPYFSIDGYFRNNFRWKLQKTPDIDEKTTDLFKKKKKKINGGDRNKMFR